MLDCTGITINLTHDRKWFASITCNDCVILLSTWWSTDRWNISIGRVLFGPNRCTGSEENFLVLCIWPLGAFMTSYHHYYDITHTCYHYICSLWVPEFPLRCKVLYLYSISQEICTRFLLCCALLWLYIDWFSHIHQAYFTSTVAI